MAKSTVTILVNGKWSGDGFSKAASELARLGKLANTSARDASKLISKFDADAKKYQAQVASTSASTSKSVMDAAAKIVGAGARIYNTSEKLSSLGSTLTTNVTMPMVAIGTYAGVTAVKFDTAMADLRKTADMTEAELRQMGDSARELSTTQPVSADQIIGIEALGAQLGIANQSLEGFAKTVMGMDIATNMDASTAATEMARFANIVGMADEDMGRYGSTLVAIGNNMATTESEVSQMAQRFASAGHQAGLSEAQILGMSAAMSSLGIKAEMGGSALSQIFVSIGKAVADGGDKLDAFAARAGMSADEFRKAWGEDAAGAFNALIEGIGGATKAGEDMNVIMGELGFTQIRQSDVMRRLAGSTQAVTDKQSVLKGALDLANEAWESNTALQAEVDKRNESMASRLQVFKNKVDDVAITVGGPLVEAAISALDAAAPLFECIGDLADAFARMDEEGQQQVLMLAGLAAAAGPASSTLGSLWKGVANLVTGVGHGIQAFGAYADAMYTVDGAQIRSYSSLKTLESRLGLSKNAVVEAAGGVERYVETWEKWYDASKRAAADTDRLASVMEELGAINKGTADGTVKHTKAIQKRKAALEADEEALNASISAATELESKSRKQLDTWAEMAGTQRRVTDETKKMGGVLKITGAEFASMAKSAMLTAGAGLAVAALGAAVAAVAEDMRKAKERQDLLNESGKTFGQVAREAAEGAESQARSLDDLSESVGETMQGIADLNKKAGETMEEVAVNEATLDTYVSTIEKLGGKSSLTATEQERLKLAVEGYNSITGDSVQVTDAAKGALSKSTEEIDRNAEAWKRNAKAQAMQEIAIEYTKKQVEAEMELGLARDKASKASERYDKLAQQALSKQQAGVALSEEESSALVNAAEKREKANKTLADAEHNYESASKSMDELTRMQVLNSDACQRLIETLNGMEGVVGPLETAGVSIEDLSVKLADAGYSADQMAEMGPKIAELATKFNGDIDTMVWALQNYNTTPIENKDGSINVNDAELIDAQGNVYTWNGTAFVDKSGKVAVNGTELRDAQGRVYTWNNTGLESKSADTKVDSEQVQKDIDRTGTRRKNPPKSLRASTSIDSSSTKTDIDRTRKRRDNPPRNQSATTTITRYENTVRSTRASTYMAAGGYRLHADGGIATRATVLTSDIVGEAGAEAIVPLTNRRYAMPFVRMVADETARSMRGGRGGGDTYNLYLDGSRSGQMTPRVEGYVEAIFNEYKSNMRTW